MTSIEILDRFKEIGVDIDETLDRFLGNDDMYVVFLVKFASGVAFEKLRAALAEKNYDEVLNNAHSLKGESGNLGIKPLFSIYSKMVDDVRNGNYSELEPQFAEAEKFFSLFRETTQKLKLEKN